MSTPFLNFSQNATEDITNTPNSYHNFNGASVRIKAYWTADIWQRFDLWSQSFFLIQKADSILRRYTLSLDVLPIGAPAAVHTALRSNLNRLFSGPSRGALDVGRLPESVRSFGGAVLDQIIDEVAMTKAGLLNFHGSINIPAQGWASPSELQKVRDLINPITDESRLVVIFAPIDGYPDGYTSRDAQWLPWVLVDPRSFASSSTLIHEMGHACRLAHQQEDLGLDAPNVMFPNTTNQRQFWGWQVDTIYDSYWCTGQRPQEWWDKKNDLLPLNHPFLWG